MLELDDGQHNRSAALTPDDFVFLDPEGRRVRIDMRPVTKEDLDHYINDLLHTDWESDNAPMVLRPDLQLADVGPTRMFDATRAFLRYLEEIGGAPLTGLGRMKRKVVAGLIERMSWAEEHIEPIRHIMKKVDEHDARPVEIVRVVCEVGGLVRKKRSSILVTRKGLELCADSKAGLLYRHLFITLFHRVNLDFLYGSLPTPQLQWSVPVILWRLSLTAKDWLDMPHLMDETLLTQVRRELAAEEPFPDHDQHVLVARVLKPLLWFGLLETEGDPEHWRWLQHSARFRKTPLFDRFLQFWWQATADPIPTPPDPRFN
ncbi:hypothetical protein FJY69_07665 [candidate division WOR-3 bacterium]|nr:hypothetical protein [candidate division WOR-3 bacterium]